MTEEDPGLQEEREKTLAVFGVGEKFGLSFKKKQCFDFFFYSDLEDNASNLAVDLHKRGYEVNVYHEPGGRIHPWGIIGTTHEMDTDLDFISKWSEEMYLLAKEHHSVFDGWGSETG